ncbi:MAG: hypothetical protein F6J97_06100 [Leptolyngbya sp. SIO4C1]|nr:hypothetical protein [Leptolyngbya sp. SIO4C1]
MRTALKKLTSATLISLGALFLLASPYSLSKKDVPQPQGWLGYLLIGTPLMIGGAWLWGSPRSHSAETQRRRQILYELIQAKQGQFTLIEFAIAADLPGQEARDYLLEQARAFGADYQITETGRSQRRAKLSITSSPNSSK